ncbi:Response regulator GacA [Cupriavidus respiraculi]|uniref:Response regulator GacA n=1 Tax=Cupriavidus respiraculi TaxID=195930 RepID=A0ABM8X7W2_9BURK|nr:Response regulator GacA [Cupriavidus respiraculi]
MLILSTYPEDQYAINLIRAGASGYLTKESAPDDLVKAIRTVAQGRRYVSATVAELLIGGLEKPTDQPLHQTLSKREFQIFCKLSRGQSVSVIADELFLSVKTVSTYRSRILEKMGMKTNADLTYYAIKNGLVE